MRRPEAPRNDGHGPRIVIFAANLLLTFSLEHEGPERDQVHFHAGGQGVWVARMAACLGATPVLCGFIGDESGELLHGLLQQLGAEWRLVSTSSASGCYVTDRRSGTRRLLACALSDPPSRHELDELFSITCAEAITAGWLIVTNPMPAQALPLELYGDLVADARASGCRTLVDLRSGGFGRSAPGGRQRDRRAAGRDRLGEDRPLRGAERVLRCTITTSVAG
jgi:1-phosphofructokinase